MYKPVEAQPDFAKMEEEILAFWQEKEIFEKSVAQNQEKPLYVIYDGPPTANAKPPLHTMVPMSFKDLVGRYQTMRGYFVPRQAGWDTHGLPVEVQVEKALGLSGKQEILNLVPGDEKASIRKFNEICQNSVWEFKKEWDRFVPRVGYWTDIQNPYITYNPGYIEKVWGVFKQIWDKGLVYKGYKVVPYCPRCGTSLSAAEVAQEYQDIKDTSVYVSFPLADNPGRAFLAWTTTPWTLPGNVALAVGPEIDYVVIRQEGGEYVLAKSRLSVVKGDYTILEELKGKDLVGKKYLPLFPGAINNEQQAFRVVAADFVSTEDGTGIVHTAVMYGVDDFNLGQVENLPCQHTVGLDGRFLAEVPEFAGLDVREALVPILKSLAEKNRLYSKEVINHSYPFCWRCKTALIYYAKDSWFIEMSKLREDLIKANDEVRWYPDYIKEGRFGDFIREARDWAVSRERFWGTPLPVWISKTDPKKMLCVGSYAELRLLAKEPQLVGEGFDPHRPQVDEIILEKDGEEYQREPLVLDVWFDSGAMPFASSREAKGQFPADYIAEAIDQTRGWFYTLMAISTILKGQSSYRRVTCMGHLVDEHGKKMSKSLGNIFDPWETFKICGVDALRWFLYTVNSPGEPKAFSPKELLVSFRKSILLLWNVFNYFVTYANVSDFESPSEAELVKLKAGNYPGLTALDRWVLDQQLKVGKEVEGFMEAYDFMRAGRALEQYINDISTWYLRRSRRREDQTFYVVMYDLLLHLVKMLAPFTPFVTEKIYQTLRRQEMPESVHLSAWPVWMGETDKSLDRQMRLLRQAVELGLSIRAEAKIKVRQPLARLYIRIDGEKLNPELLEILADELNVKEVIERDISEEGLASREIEGLALALDTNLTEDLIQAGLAREFLRQVQQLRKNRSLRPGQQVVLHIDPSAKSLVEPLLKQYSEILKDAYIGAVDWQPNQVDELKVGEQSVFIDLKS